MFGFNKFTSQEMCNPHAKALFLVQMTAVGLYNGKKANVSFMEAKKQLDLMNDYFKKHKFNDVQKHAKSFGLMNEATSLAMFQGREFDKHIVRVIDTSKNTTLKELMCCQMVYNVFRKAKYFKKQFGIDTKLNHTVDFLNRVQTGQPFNGDLLMMKTYPEIQTNKSIVDLIEELQNSPRFDKNKEYELDFKMTEIKNLVVEKPFLANTQKFEYFRTSLDFVLKTESESLISAVNNPASMDIRFIFNDLHRGEKSKDLIQHYVAADLDLELEIDDLFEDYDSKRSIVNDSQLEGHYLNEYNKQQQTLRERELQMHKMQQEEPKDEIVEEVEKEPIVEKKVVKITKKRSRNGIQRP